VTLRLISSFRQRINVVCSGNPPGSRPAFRGRGVISSHRYRGGGPRRRLYRKAATAEPTLPILRPPASFRSIFPALASRESARSGKSRPRAAPIGHPQWLRWAGGGKPPGSFKGYRWRAGCGWHPTCIGCLSGSRFTRLSSGRNTVERPPLEARRHEPSGRHEPSERRHLPERSSPRRQRHDRL